MVHALDDYDLMICEYSVVYGPWGSLLSGELVYVHWPHTNPDEAGRATKEYYHWTKVSLISGHGYSFQDDVYGIQSTWSYFQGFGKPFPFRNGTFYVVSWWSKPLKIRPLHTLGGILFEMSS
jgi:hypothetical protein